MTRSTNRAQISSLLALAIAGLLAVALPIGAGDAPPPSFSGSLFDGLSLDGWTAENGCEAAVEDGRLVLKTGDGWLRCDHIYRDFILHVEWKAFKPAGYDAGIFIRPLPEGKPFPGTGYQVNLLQGKEGTIGNLAVASAVGMI